MLMRGDGTSRPRGLLPSTPRRPDHLRISPGVFATLCSPIPPASCGASARTFPIVKSRLDPGSPQSARSLSLRVDCQTARLVIPGRCEASNPESMAPQQYRERWILRCAIAHHSSRSRAPWNDENYSDTSLHFRYAFAFSRHDLPELCQASRPKTEGAGNAGCATAPAASRAK